MFKSASLANSGVAMSRRESTTVAVLRARLTLSLIMFSPLKVLGKIKGLLCFKKLLQKPVGE
jgi:hypothetical protein